MVNSTFPILLILASSFLFSCGYNFVGASPINLPRNMVNLHIALVQNPTQEAWIEPYVRSQFRDEFSRRGRVEWVSEDQAQGLVHIDIQQFRTSDALTRERDRTVKADVAVTMNVQILSADTGQLIWSSGAVTGRSSYFLAAEDVSMPGSSGPEQRRASQEAVDEAVTRVADRLGDGF